MMFSCRRCKNSVGGDPKQEITNKTTIADELLLVIVYMHLGEVNYMLNTVSKGSHSV